VPRLPDWARAGPVEFGRSAAAVARARHDHSEMGPSTPQAIVTVVGRCRVSTAHRSAMGAVSGTHPVRSSGLTGRVSERSVLLVASFGAFLAFLDATIVNVAFPSIRSSFPTVTVSDLSWVLNAYNIVFAAALVPAGRLADLVGRRRAFGTGCWCSPPALWPALPPDRSRSWSPRGACRRRSVKPCPLSTERRRSLAPGEECRLR